ncbi:MAG TPA: hypothetical protein V6C76_02100 [Drouetiella sp.]
MIEPQVLEQLQKRELFTSHPIPAFQNGVWVVKPEHVAGNHIPGHSGGYTCVVDEDGDLRGQIPCPETNAPMLKLIHTDNIWEVNGWDCAGAMGPADFTNDWKTPEEAIADVLDFFFGDPRRMKAKELFRQDPKGEIEKAKRENRMPVPKWQSTS